MTPEEMFDQAFVSAMQDRRDLVRFLEGVSEAQAQWRPPDGEWSIVEGLEHIMLTEEWFRARLLTILREAETSGATHFESVMPKKSASTSPAKSTPGQQRQVDSVQVQTVQKPESEPNRSP